MSEVLEAQDTGLKTQTTEQTTDTSEAQNIESTTTNEPSKPDYSYVPQKFLKEDGTPDFERLSKSYVGLEKKLGATRNIAPSSEDEYEYDFQGVDVDDEVLSQFKKSALEKGLTKEQYKFVLDTHKENVSKLIWSADRTAEALKGEWGKEFESNLSAAKAGFDEFAPSDANPNDPVWNHPAVMKLLARIGAEVGEDSLSNKGKAAGASVMTQAEVDQIMKSDAYMNGDRVLHAKVTDWYQKYYKG